LHSLLSHDGALFLHLDDNELHYAKVMCDEIFGRKHFVSSIVWQKVFARKNKAVISESHDTILIYAKDSSKWRRNLLGRTPDQVAAFSNPDGDPRGMWQSVSYSVPSEDSERRIAYRYQIDLPAGGTATPPQGRHWNGLPERTRQLVSENRLWFGPKRDRAPRMKVFLSEVKDGIVPDTWWRHEDLGNNQEAKKEIVSLFPDQEPFPTPKPERLMRRIIEIASDPGDIVLDSFAGSGTTGAVAHKMGRRWIMVELGDHCKTHIVPRLMKVIDGDDPGGITKAVEWRGGGGYRYFRLAPSLLEKDQFGQWVISKAYNSAMLAEAMCKHFGFTYAPSDEHYWMHGQSSETDFIYVTTNSLTHDQLRAISNEVGDERSLLICCKAFQAANADALANLTIRKIPGAILDRCEWGKDDYSLKIEALPLIEDGVGEGEAGAEVQSLAATPPEPKRRGRPRQTDDSPSLFDGEDEA
jgi:adenine-specific DNA-methyltransferase